MRTTLTLEPDVAHAVERLRRERRLSLKQVINEALRIGLADLEAAPAPRRVATEPVSHGQSRIGDLRDVSEVLAIAEGEDRR